MPIGKHIAQVVWILEYKRYQMKYKFNSGHIVSYEYELMKPNSLDDSFREL